MPDTPARPMTAKDLTRITFVSDPQISPDGQRVAFVATTLSDEKDEYLSNIWVVDTAGGEPRRFTGGQKRDTAPRWSPDGSRLAFLSEREAKKPAQLYVMPTDGGEARRLTDIKRGVSNPVWSPDGARIAFTSKTGGWEEPENEEEKAKSRPARIITTLKYKMNGEGFVHDRHQHIFVIPADGGEPVQLTDGDWSDSPPVWSPDSASLAFTSARHPDRDYDNASDLFTVPAAGGDARRLTATAMQVFSPSFSPDGSTIAYLCIPYLNEAGRNARVFTIPAAGGEPRNLTANLDRTCQSFGGSSGPAWSADGRSLFFVIEDCGDVPLYRVAADGSGTPEQVIGGPRQVTGVSFSRDGTTMAFTATDPLAPAEVYVAGAGGGNERQLTDLNREWKKTVALSVPERHQFERDGHTVDVWVMKPFGFEAGKRYPALLNVHGGPATQYGHSFFDEFQVYAGAGFGIIFCNPRGSQGYGEEFTRAVIRDWGGGDYADVMMATDVALEKAPWIDGDRLGIIGGSYGGFMTSWAIGHTDRFKAACSERALNTHYSMFGSSDIGHSFPEAYSGGALPWDDREWYLKHSPLTYAHTISTPTLILHSEQDLRCPMEQAEQLFAVLKKLRREVLFIRFPDESHELTRSGRPRHRIERFGYVVDWFSKWIPVGGK